MDPRSSNPCCSRVNCTMRPIHGRVYWTQRIKTQWEYNGKEPRKKTWTPCREKELALQPTLGSSLWTSAINTPSFCVYFSLCHSQLLYIFFCFVSVLSVGTAAYSDGFLPCHCLIGPFRHPYVSLWPSFNFSSHWISLISQIKIFKRIKLAQFIFPQRRPWGKGAIWYPTPIQSASSGKGDRREVTGSSRCMFLSRACEQSHFPW